MFARFDFFARTCRLSRFALIAFALAGKAFSAFSTGARGPVVAGAAARATLVITARRPFGLNLRLTVEDRPIEIDIGLGGESLAQLVGKDAGLDFLDGAFVQLAELERPVGQANQAIDRQSHMFEQAFDFAVFAFAQPEADPDIGALDAVELGVDAGIFHAVNRHAARQSVELGLVGLAIGAGAITAQPTGGRQFEHARQAAIIGQQQQPLGIDVESADRHQAGQVGEFLGDIVENRRASLGIPVGGDEAARLVEQEEAGALARRQRAAVHSHAVFRRDVERGAGQNRAIDRNAAFGDPDFGVAARAKPGARHDLGDAVAMFGGFGRLGERLFRDGFGAARFFGGVVIVIVVVVHPGLIAEAEGFRKVYAS